MTPQILISGGTGSRKNYSGGIAAAGGIPCDFYLPEPGAYDGLVLCGGGDIHPKFFGQADNGVLEIDTDRDECELALVAHYVAQKKPILGICRGHQLLNVALGGTLVQDIAASQRAVHYPEKQEHGDKVHLVQGETPSLFSQHYGPRFLVNSYHHQAVDRLGRGLHSVLWSEDGIVEGLVHESLPIFSTQFHPERMGGVESGTVDGGAIFRYFIQLCQGTIKM